MKTKNLGKFNILVTSAGVGTAVNVIKALRASKKFSVTISASDQDPDAAGLFLSDKTHITPNANHPEFFKHIKKIIKEDEIDFIFPNHSSEILLFSQNTDFFSSLNVGVVLPDEECVITCSDKKAFINFLKKNNFSYPCTYSSLEEVTKFPIFIKPVSGSSSNYTFFAEDIEKAKSFISLYDVDFLFQRFIDAEEITADCYVNKNSKLVACVPRSRLKVKDGKSVVGKTLYNIDLINFIDDLLTKIKYKGPCNVQLFRNENKFQLIEINPRMSAGGLPLTVESGINIPELILQDYFFGLPDKLIEFEDRLTMYTYSNEIFVR